MRDSRSTTVLRRRYGVGAAALAALAVSACTDAEKAEFREEFKIAVHGDREIPPANLNRLQWQNVSQRVYFAPGYAAVTREQAHALDLFLRRVDAKPGEPVQLIAGHSDQTNSRALADRRIAAVRAYVAGRRLSVAQVAVVPGADDADSVTVSIGRNTAVVPNCPNWQSVLVNGQFESDRKQFGCVTMQSLGAQVDNVNDLVRGRELGKGDGVAFAKGVQDYRAGPSTSSTSSTSSPTSTTPAAATTTK